jgi:hypothetical protein
MFPAKVLNSTEDAHVENMNTFGVDEAAASKASKCPRSLISSKKNWTS